MEQTGLLRPEENARLPGSWGVGVWSQGRGLDLALLRGAPWHQRWPLGEARGSEEQL